MALIHEDRRGLTSSMSPEEVRKLGIEGLMLLDLRLCRRDSETIGTNQNLADVAAWVPAGAERALVLSWATAEQREDRIGRMEELAEAGEWHDLSCHLTGWHDDLLALNAIYGRWAADAPRRNASKPRRGKEWVRALADHLNSKGARTMRAKFRDIPSDNQDDPLILCDGKFEITHRVGESRAGTCSDLIRCEFEDGRKPDEISFTTFERHLKKSKAIEKRRGG